MVLSRCPLVYGAIFGDLVGVSGPGHSTFLRFLVAGGRSGAMLRTTLSTCLRRARCVQPCRAIVVFLLLWDVVAWVWWAGWVEGFLRVALLPIARVMWVALHGSDFPFQDDSFRLVEHAFGGVLQPTRGGAT